MTISIINHLAWGSNDSNLGKIGGIMDYGNARLSNTNTNDQYRFGFNEATEKNSMCTKISNLITANSVGPNKCMLDVAGSGVTTMSLYTANGILDPFEQCDGSDPSPYPSANPTTCCNNKGRFIDQSATCAYQNECCNSSCQALPASTACSVNAADTAKTGYCSLGICVPACLGASCTNGAVQNPVAATAADSCQAKCQWTCSGSPGFTYSNTRDALIGTTCGGTTATPSQCIPTSTSLTSSTGQYTCTAHAAAGYTWKSYVVRECSGTVMPLTAYQIDSYLCMNPMGTVVGDNFCSSATRPAPTQTCAVFGTYTVSVTPTTSQPAGSTQTLTWVYSGSNYYNTVSIVYYLGTTRTSVVASNVNVLLGTYTVQIPTSSGAGTGKWRVERTGSSTYFGESATFVVTVPATTISTPVLSGTVAGQQSTLTFTVSFGAANSCLFEYYSSSSATGVTLTTSPSGNFAVGSHSVTFTIPNTVTASTTAFIRITSSTTAQTAAFTLTKYNWVTVYDPATCPTFSCTAVTQVASLSCQKTVGTTVSTETANTSLCGTQPSTPANKSCTLTSCGANGSCAPSGTSCTCTNGYSGTTCATSPGTLTVGALTGTTAGSSSSLAVTVSGSAVTITKVRYISTTPSVAVDITSYSPTAAMAVGSRTVTFTIPAGTTASANAQIELTVSGGAIVKSSTFSLTSYKYAPVWSPASCPTNRCSQSTQTGTQTCTKYVGGAAGVAENSNTNCGSQSVPAVPANQICPATFSCGTTSQGSCASSGTTCTCVNGWSGTGCSTKATISNVSLIPTDSTTTLSAVDSASTFRVRFTYSGSPTEVQLHVMNGSSIDTAQSVITATATADVNLVTFNLANLSTRTNAVIRVRVTGDTSINSSSSEFTIYTYAWVSNLGAFNPATCPTNNCATVSRTRAAGCQRSAGTTLTTVSRGCTGSPPSPTSTTPCPVTISSCGTHGTCTNGICACDTNWSGAACESSVTLSDVKIAIPNSDSTTNDVNIGTSDLTLTWIANGPTTTLDVVFKQQSGATTVIAITQVQSNASPFTFNLPFDQNGIVASSQGVIALRVSNASNDIEATPSINAISYSWSLGPWSQCSTKICAKGQQYRSSKCLSSNDITSTQDYCNPSTKPIGSSNTQECIGGGGDTNDNSSVGCGTNGTCDEQTDTCQCNEGYMGTTCQGTTTCNGGSTLTCANNSFVASNNDTCDDKCTCVNSWVTSTDNTSAATASCTECSLQCNTSPLQRDENSLTGIPSNDCSQCKCNRGYFSTQCGCREIYITLPFSTYPKTNFISSNAANATDITLRQETVEQYKAQLDHLASLEGIIGRVLSSNRVTITWWFIDSQGVLQITTTIKGQCKTDTSSEMILNSQFDQFDLLSTTDDKQQIYEKLRTWVDTVNKAASSSSSFAVLSSSITSTTPIEGFEIQTPLEFTNALYDPSCLSSDFDSVSTYTCDSASKQSPFTTIDGGEDPNNKGKGNKGKIIGIAVAVVAAVVILVVAIILICCCCACCCFAGSSGNNEEKQRKKQQREQEKQEKERQKQEKKAQKSTEMTTPEPYTANPMVAASAAPSAPMAPKSPMAPQPPMAPQAPGAPRPPMAPQAPQQRY